MPKSTTELVRLAFDALNRKDLEGFLALVDPKVEFNSLIAEADTGTFHGHEGVRQWWEAVQLSLGGLSYKLEEVRDLGEMAVVKMRVTGEARGVPIEQTMWQAARRRGDRVVWWMVGRTEDDVIAAGQEAAEN
jgi:ketosteroid isomerase-like protein